MSDTPRTDKFTEPFNARELLAEARQLERELAACRANTELILVECQHVVAEDKERITVLESRLASATEALRIIAGQTQCVDNLLSNQEVAIAALSEQPDDGRVLVDPSVVEDAERLNAVEQRGWKVQPNDEDGLDWAVLEPRKYGNPLCLAVHQGLRSAIDAARKENPSGNR